MADIGLVFNWSFGIMNYRNRNTLRVLQLQGSACLVYFENDQCGSFLLAVCLAGAAIR
jgi:predicted RNA-binding protein with PUA-like domain